MKDKHKSEKDQQPSEDKPDLSEEAKECIADDKNKAGKIGFGRHLLSKVKSGDFTFLKGLGGFIDEYQEFRDNRENFEDKYAAYETVVQGATDTLDYYILLILSCLIATFGLYINSAAVIIGAMIVAPLMGPILGFAAGWLWGNWRVLLEASTTLLKGTLVVVSVTFLLTFFIPGIVVNAEMMSRSQPTMFDIVIALSCGFVGAYAFANKRITSAIPGVAISVALLPPLCTAGIGLGLNNYSLAKGAALLFALNIISIFLASLIVFYLVRMHPHIYNEKEKRKMRVRAFSQVITSTILLVVISVPLLFFMKRTIIFNRHKELIYEHIQSLFTDDKIYSLEVNPGNKYDVEAIILHDGSIEKKDISRLKQQIEQKISHEIKLSIFTINGYSK